jgi:hypothetical protein
MPEGLKSHGSDSRDRAARLPHASRRIVVDLLSPAYPALTEYDKEWKGIIPQGLELATAFRVKCGRINSPGRYSLHHVSEGDCLLNRGLLRGVPARQAHALQTRGVVDRTGLAEALINSSRKARSERCRHKVSAAAQ